MLQVVMFYIFADIADGEEIILTLDDFYMMKGYFSISFNYFVSLRRQIVGERLK